MNNLLYLIITNAVFVSIVIGVGMFLLVAHWEEKARKEKESKWPQVGKRMKLPKTIEDSLDEIEKKIS